MTVLTNGCAHGKMVPTPSSPHNCAHEVENVGSGRIPMRSTCAITVTYGSRSSLLFPVLTALLKDSALGKIIVVNNGAEWDVRALATDLAPNDRIEIVEFTTNQGSAAGFAAGIQRACSLGTEFIWLLDDDNLPESDTLRRLFEAYWQLGADFPKDRLAVAALRPANQAEVTAGVPLWPLGRRPSSFRGVHALDLPYNLWRYVRKGTIRPGGCPPALIELAVAPYGGLLFHRAVVERHGLPSADFVLYGDDTEFTYRITRAGGVLRLVTSARISDLEMSWSLKSRFGTTFRALIEGGNDLRAYYSARNQAYIDSHCFQHNRVAFWINRQIYCVALWLFAIVLGRRDRYRLLRNAIRDGIDGRLGIHPRHPL